MNTSIDIIIPCYNPIDDWVDVLIHSYEALEEQTDFLFSFILVNDGSTVDIASKDIFRLEQNIARFKYYSYDQNRGKGYAIRYGMSHSTTDNVVFTDIDFPYGITSIINMANMVLNGSDLVLALRDDSYYSNISASRKMISKFLKFSIKTFFSIPYSDTQGGLKAMSKLGKQKLMATTIDRYLFDLELVKLCTKDKLNIDGIACKLKPDIILSSVGLSILRKEFSNFLKVWNI